MMIAIRNTIVHILSRNGAYKTNIISILLRKRRKYDKNMAYK